MFLIVFGKIKMKQLKHPLVLIIDEDKNQNSIQEFSKYFSEKHFEIQNLVLDTIPNFDENLFLSHDDLIEIYKFKKISKILNLNTDRYCIVIKSNMMSFLSQEILLQMIKDSQEVNAEMIFFHKFSDIMTQYQNTPYPYIKYTISPNSLNAFMVSPYSITKILESIKIDKPISVAINEALRKGSFKGITFIPNIFDLNINKLTDANQLKNYNQFLISESTNENSEIIFYTFLGIILALILFMILYCIVDFFITRNKKKQ